MPPSRYPENFDISSASAPDSRAPLGSKTESKGRAIRAPSTSVNNVLQDPVLSTIIKDQHDHDSEWELIPTGNGPGTETGGSQTTTTTNNATDHTAPAVVGGNDASDADSRIHSGLSETGIQALCGTKSDLASKGHTTITAMSAICANLNGMSVSSTNGSYCHGSCYQAGSKNSYSPANAARADFEVSNMASWAEENIDELNQD
ncbi:hypothetical protein Trco_000528 [Trichoderma cornu-damae]|uniref:Uncharacterized protein n=1 Tax=Trichoderma cornu-damae TaxID=654480 RepID=A0A9P8TZC6_9HYPO|nr:hypothetical protein Trco_000528 [Trichoderma cornu-damae]